MKKAASADVMMEVLYLIHQKMPVGVAVTDADWNLAYDMVRANACIDTLKWKLENMQILSNDDEC